MSYNIGPKIGIDGEKEFRNSIKQINDTYKALDAETRALTAAFDAQGDEQGKLEATSKQLQKQLDLQKQKMGLLEDAVKKASEKYGENSIEATRLRGALYDTQATVSKLETELEDTSSALNGTGDAMEDFAEEAEDASDAALSFGDVLKANIASDLVLDTIEDIGSAIKDFATEAIDAAADIKASTSKFKQSFGEMEGKATAALESIADEAGITATRLQDSYASIYAFNKAIGSDSETSLDIASRSLRAAADSAAYYDKSVEDATETLQSFLKGNYENDAALGISATETARNTMSNQLYAKSFIELSEAQKVDVLLAMVEAGNKASGALGQAAREADSWTNVTGELDESWHQFLGTIGSPILEGVIPIIQGITDALNRMTEKSAAEKFSDALEEIEDNIEKSNKRLSETQETIEINAILAQKYVERLGALEKAGLKTAEAQKEYSDVVELLNELMPELNLKISEQTGLVNKSTSAILQNVESLKQQALQEALMANYSDYLNACAEAQIKIAEAEKALIPLQAEYDRLLEEIAKNGGNAAWVTGGFSDQLRSIPEPLKTLSDKLNANSAEQRIYNESITEGKENLEKYEKEIARLKELMGDLIGVQDETEAATNSLTETEKKAAAALDTKKEKIEETIAGLLNLPQAYEAAKAAALDSINTQIGLFDELVLSSEYSAEKIIENWASQQAAFNNYSANLQKAIDLGLDQVLVSQLSDGSAESMMILDALVNDVEISIDEVNAAFGTLSESKDALAATLGEMKVIASEDFANIASLAKTAGVNVVDGLIAGVESQQDAYAYSLSELAKLGIRSFNKEMAINSPAKKMIPSGEYTVEGAIVGVDNMAGAFEDAMSGLAVAGADAFLGKQLDRVWEYPSVVQNPVRYSRSVSHNYGGQTFQIYQQPGESNEDLAYRIMEIMQQEVEVKEAGFGA